MRYFEVIKDSVSICLDSDVGYYHFYNVGDIIEIKFNDELRPIISPWGITSDDWDYTCQFTIDCYKTCSQTLSLGDMITLKYVMEITQNVIRQKQIDKIIIDHCI